MNSNNVWVEKVSAIYKKGIEPSFKDLIEYKQERARAAGCQHSALLVLRNDQHRASVDN